MTQTQTFPAAALGSDHGTLPEAHVTFALLGEAVTLLSQSPLHAARPLSDLSALILPPLLAGQVRIWRRGVLPVALATWAWLDEATEHAVLHEDHLPGAEEWSNGTNPVVIDLVAPFGDAFAVARDLKREVFPGRALRSVRRDATGRAVRIVQHPGRDHFGFPVKPRAYPAANAA